MKISKWTAGNIAGGIAGGLVLGLGIGLIAYGYTFSQLPQDFVLPGYLITLGGLTVLGCAAISTSIQVERYLGKKWSEYFEKKFEKWKTEYTNRTFNV